MTDPLQRTVLVVENIAEISLQMEAMLLRKGHRVVLASDATEAMKIAENDQPALILTDIDLPTFDSLLQSIRGHQTLKHMVVAIIDLNGPEVKARHNVKIVSDFAQLDDLLGSIPRVATC